MSLSRLRYITLIAFACVVAPSVQAKAVEVSPLFSFYSGDSLRASFGATLQSTYRINREFWLGVEGTLVQARYEGNTIPQGDILGVGVGSVFWNVLGQLGGDDASDGQPIDLYTSLSLGALTLGSQTQMVGSIGGGMAVHFPSLPWLLVKFDLKNLFYMLERTSSSSFQTDMILSLGASFLF